MTDPEAPGPSSPSSLLLTSDDLSVRTLLPLANYLREREGSSTLQRIAEGAGLMLAHFDGRSHWISLEQAEQFLAEARKLFPSDEAMKDACAYKYAEMSYGPILMAARATTPFLGYTLGTKFVNAAITRVGRYEPPVRQGSWCILRYYSKRKESYLMCLAQQAQIAAVTTLWGLPPANVQHPRCIARGDACCEYVFKLIEPARWLPAFVGFVCGAGLLAALYLLSPAAVATPWSGLLPVSGMLLGLGLEWRRASLANQRGIQDAEQASILLAQEQAEARREIMELLQRQSQWTRLMEEQIAERLAAQQRVVDQIRHLETERLQALRSVSHDLRTPLGVLRVSTEIMRLGQYQISPTDQSLLDGMDKASEQMNRLIVALMETLSAQSAMLQLTPRPLPVGALVERLHRRLSALCYSREIRVGSVSTPEAPETIEIDELLLDRVLDNLLSNAAKYTERGSILIEIGGTPGFLTVKVADTGRGIAPDAIECIFQSSGSDVTTRAANSYGLGLSVVVQLLAQIGGRLEVMSEPGVGTTFWAHFPVRPIGSSVQVGGASAESPIDLMRRIVTIRKARG